MNICLVHEEYPEETNFGGIATYERACAEEYVKQGHTVYVIARGLKETYEYVENGVNIYRIFVEQTEDQIANYVTYRNKVCEKLKELQDNNLIDIIEVPDWGAETVLFEEYRKVPLVVRLHTPLKVWLKFNKNNFGEVTKQMLEWEDKMLRHADLITCCSSALKRLIVKGFKIDKDRIKVTPNPANIGNFYYDKNIKKENVLLYLGSLEERKGVIVLAKALNHVFEKYPSLTCRFIGKDTTRNKLNISTVKYITELVDEKYRDNLEFLGQIPNYNLNKYLNSARACVYPSLFDNFPYVVLETMVTGTPIVGSSNSGMVEMLEDSSSIYNTGDYKNLADVIIRTLKTKTFEQRNIDRVNYLYNPTTVCETMVKMYETTIKTFYRKEEDVNMFQEVLKTALNKDVNVTKVDIQHGGVANIVYKVETDCGSYIIKSYLYDYDFGLSNELYDRYEENGIQVVRPINPNPIKIKHSIINVFNYYNNENFNLDMDYLSKLVLCDRKCDVKEAQLVQKCRDYYNGINNIHNNEGFLANDSKMVQLIFESVAGDKLFKENYLNHGDISKSNIISNNGTKYLIDFDEAKVAPRLYDFAVITVKLFSHNGVLKNKEFLEFFNKIYPNLNYTKQDYLTMIKFYLCKILLEKFYLHYTNKINLKSKEQMKDNYVYYVRLLNYFKNLKEI